MKKIRVSTSSRTLSTMVEYQNSLANDVKISNDEVCSISNNNKLRASPSITPNLAITNEDDNSTNRDSLNSKGPRYLKYYREVKILLNFLYNYSLKFLLLYLYYI